jgi:hypothetical protein
MLTEPEYTIISENNDIYVEYGCERYKRVLFEEVIDDYPNDLARPVNCKISHSVAFRTTCGMYTRNWSSPVKIENEAAFLLDSGVWRYASHQGYNGTPNDLLILLSTIRHDRNMAILSCRHNIDFVAQLAKDMIDEKVFS